MFKYDQSLHFYMIGIMVQPLPVDLIIKSLIVNKGLSMIIITITEEFWTQILFVNLKGRKCISSCHLYIYGLVHCS